MKGVALLRLALFGALVSELWPRKSTMGEGGPIDSIPTIPPSTLTISPIVHARLVHAASTPVSTYLPSPNASRHYVCREYARTRLYAQDRRL